LQAGERRGCLYDPMYVMQGSRHGAHKGTPLQDVDFV
jgi:hypothetical protein